MSTNTNDVRPPAAPLDHTVQYANDVTNVFLESPHFTKALLNFKCGYGDYVKPMLKIFLVRQKYRDCVRTYNSLLRQHQKETERDIIDANNVGTFYKYVNNRLGSKSGVSPLCGPDGKLVTNDYSKAELLNNLFASVATTDDGKIPPLVGKVMCTDKIEHVNFNTFVVQQAIKNKNNNLSDGPDGLPPLLFKKLCDGLAHPLSIFLHAATVSFSSPFRMEAGYSSTSIQKRASVDVSNYRPISLTCISSKIMERIIVNSLMDHFHKNNIISKAQHGFLKRLSTLTNLLESFNDWTLALQNHSGVELP